MNLLLAGVASVGAVVCVTAFVLFATSSVWTFLILAVIIGVAVYGSGDRPRAASAADVSPGSEAAGD